MKKSLAKIGTGLGVLLTPALAFAQVQTIDLNAIIAAIFPTQVGGTNIFILFNGLFRILIVLAAIIAIFYLIWAGIQYITASTDEEKAKKARTAIYNAIIGIVVIVLSYAIIVWVGNLVKEQVNPGVTPNGTIQGGFPG